MKNLKTLILAGILTSAVMTLSHNAAADVAESEKQAANAIKFRQSLLQLVRSNIGPLGAMAKGHIPYDTEVMYTNSVRLEQLSEMMMDYFDTDTRKFDIETAASPKIWDNMDDFADKVDALTTAAVELQAIAQTDDESGYRTAIGNLGATCKSCHDEYKVD